MSTTNNTPSEEAAKRQGYMEGRHHESLVQKRVSAWRRTVQASANNGAATGLIFGLLISGLLVVVTAFVFLGNDQDEVVPVPVPALDSNTTDIDMPDVNVDAPDVQVPDVQVNIPDATDAISVEAGAE